jgi:hypothetical protein
MVELASRPQPFLSASPRILGSNARTPDGSGTLLSRWLSVIVNRLRVRHPSVSEEPRRGLPRGESVDDSEAERRARENGSAGQPDARAAASGRRTGELREIYVPDDTDEAMRDLVRARKDAVVVGTQPSTASRPSCCGRDGAIRARGRQPGGRNCELAYPLTQVTTICCGGPSRNPLEESEQPTRLVGKLPLAAGAENNLQGLFERGSMPKEERAQGEWHMSPYERGPGVTPSEEMDMTSPQWR